MKYKVVINCSYGVFGLSLEACKYLNEKYGIKYHFNPIYDDSGYLDENLERHDKRLVDVVETLGNLVNTRHSNLCIKIIDENEYRITEFNGFETLDTPKSTHWFKIS